MPTPTEPTPAEAPREESPPPARDRRSVDGAEPASATRQTDGVLPWQALRGAEEAEWIACEGGVADDAYQPASLDLHIGEEAWALRCSFLPDGQSTVEERAAGLTLQRIDLSGGAMLEIDRPYLIPLREELRLPDDVRARANPKSSTGRLDVFTRVVTDRNSRFDEIPYGYRGRMYLEVVPRSFAIYVRGGLALNQLRLLRGRPLVADADLLDLHRSEPLLYSDEDALAEPLLSVSDGLFLSLDLEEGAPDRVVGYRAKKNSLPIDLSRIRHYRVHDYWDPVVPEKGSRIVLEPETFYLLISSERVSVPPRVAAEMLAYDPTAGELRTHYAGFFDPGFGFPRGDGRSPGSRAALEVRARDVPFMVEHGQPVCKLAFERMAAVPEVLYGDEVGSSYQGQVTMLSKHFAEQTAGMADVSLSGPHG